MDRFFADDPQLIDALLAWSRRRILDGQDPSTRAEPASHLTEAMGVTITPAGLGGAAAMARFTDVVIPATRAINHPMNLAYVPNAATSAATAFDAAVSAACVFAGAWDGGAGAIHAENQALAWLAELVGYPADAGGTFTQGGTIGNLSALVAARHRAIERRRDQGLAEPWRWRFAATGDAHSSIRSAARVMGVEVLDVPGDERGRMTGVALQAALDAHGDDDVFAVVATAGTTNAGMVDELDAIATVAGRHDLWLHVDGAFGLAARAAPSTRRLFDGIERSDSFVVDPHKWLYAPYDCCALVYRDPREAAAAHSQHASYLDQLDRSAWNPTDYAVQLSRRARGLPFWFSLATYGTERYSAAIERSLDTARQVADHIRASRHLELVVEPQLSVLLFRRAGWSAERLQHWSDAQAVAGTILCIPTKWAGEPVLRLCFVSPDTRADEVTALLDTMG